MMAAVLADGVTVIDSAACEPEIEDLANFLVAMGAKIEGRGTPRITITGVKSLHGVSYEIIPDRIEAGTYLVMAAITKGSITIKNARYDHLMSLIDALDQAGVQVTHDNSVMKVKVRNGVLQPVNITTYPYPGFPTDLQ